MKPIAVVLGTRPEIIKMSPIISLLAEKKLPFYIIHTNQHYSKELDQIFFEQLKLPQPDYSLEVGSGTHGEQTGKMLQRIEKILIENPPSFTLVQGDTNTTVAGALTSSKLHIPVGHVEAGLRSHDRKMPEEINRIITDHISDLCFVPTEKQRHILLNEGIPDQKIVITGNTIVDAVYRNIKMMNMEILSRLGLKEKQYFLATIHRQENTDDPVRLEEIFSAITFAGKKYNLPVIAPLHPRTVKKLKEYQIEVKAPIKVIPPVGYFEFLALLKHTRLVITDSGGLQEESCILGVPCVTARENTERPETIEVGANILGGVRKKTLLSAIDAMFHVEPNWKNPFGDGKSSNRIIQKILAFLQKHNKI